MPGNLGRTSLKRSRNRRNPMQDYDNLPADLRRWVSSAALPWSVPSVQRTFKTALARTGDRKLALNELDRIEQKLTAKDIRTIWGRDHPNASRWEPASPQHADRTFRGLQDKQKTPR